MIARFASDSNASFANQQRNIFPKNDEPYSLAVNIPPEFHSASNIESKISGMDIKRIPKPKQTTDLIIIRFLKLMSILL